MSTRPQSLHRYVYTENNPINRIDPSGHLSGAPPCNMLPNRPDTCTWDDIEHWWQSDGGERARQAAGAAARTPYDAITGFWDFVGQLGSDPRGAIYGAIYGTLNAPYQIGGDLLAGTVCGNGRRLGRGMANGGMAYLSAMHGAQRMLDTVIDGPPPNSPPRRGGAGGSWRTINERPDPTVVSQRDPLSCAAACGEMLLKDRGITISQDIIEKKIGKPTISDTLADILNTFDPNATGQWRSATVDPRSFHNLNKTGSWAAMLWEPGARIGHFVVVDGLDGAGNVMIRDPFHGTRYEMEFDYFLNDVWTWEAVWRD